MDDIIDFPLLVTDNIDVCIVIRFSSISFRKLPSAFVYSLMLAVSFSIKAVTKSLVKPI